MKTMNKSFKFFTVIAICVVILGMVFLGVFGFNKTLDYKDGYVLEIELNGNFGDSAEETSNKMKSAAEKYLKDNGIAYKSYAIESLDNGNVLLIKLDEKSYKSIVISDVTDKINAAISESGLSVEATTFKKQIYAPTEWGWIALALGITAVIMFVYAFFVEKLAGALASFCSAVVSALIFISIVALARIPSSPFIEAATILSAILGGALSLVLVNRCNELTKNVGNDGKSSYEIGEQAKKSSLIRIFFVGCSLTIAGLAFVIFGTSYLRFMGIQLIVAALSSVFTVYAFTAFFWQILKNDKKAKKQVAEKPVTETETK